MDANGAPEQSGLFLYMAGLATIFLFYRLVRPAIDSSRWSMAFDMRPGAPMMLILSVMFMALFLPALAIPAALVAIGVHEYGHVLAYRLAGHRDPKFMFTPLGGAAFSKQPHRSHAESFFIAMMGPGFSLILIIIGVLIGAALRETNPVIANYAFSAAYWIGLLNAINLLPIYPFDGARALQAIASAAGPKAMRTIMLALSLAMTLIAGILAPLLQFWFLLIISLFGLVMSRAFLASVANLPPMRGGIALLCLVTYAVTFAALISLSYADLVRNYTIISAEVSARLAQ